MYGDIIILQENFALFYMPHNCTKDYPGYILKDQFSCLMGAQLGMKVSCGGAERTEDHERMLDSWRLAHEPTENSGELFLLLIYKSKALNIGN
jgi:hypothetical protein